MTISFTPESIGEALATTPGADAWQVSVVRDEETQVYVIGDQTESRRTVTNERAHVTIHNLHAPHTPDLTGPMLGNTDLTLLPSDTADAAGLQTRLRDAVTMASLTDTRPTSCRGGPLLASPPSRRWIPRSKAMSPARWTRRYAACAWRWLDGAACA